MIERLDLENDLRRAIDREELLVYYQPLIDLADFSFPGPASVGNHDVDTPESGNNPIEGALYRCRAGDVTSDREGRAANGLGAFRSGISIDVEQGYFGAGIGKGARRGGANRSAGAGDCCHLTGEGQSFALAEFGQFKRPVFDVEHVGFRNRFEGADCFCAADACGRGLGNIGGDARILAFTPSPKRPRPGTNTTRGRGSCIASAGACLLA